MRTVIIAVIAALCLAQAQGTVVRRDTHTPEVTFQSLWEDAQRHFSNLTASLQAALPSNDEVKRNLQTQAQSLATNIQQAAAQFSEKATQLSGEAQAAVRQAAEHLNQTVSNLRTQFPDAAAGAEKLKASLETFAAEARRVQEAVQPHADSVAESLKSVARTAVEQATLVSSQVQQHVQQAGEAH